MPRPLVAIAVLIALLPAPLVAQGRKVVHHAAPDPWSALLLPRTHTPTPTTAAITAADLRTRLFILADDSMDGRRVGTEGNARGVEYIAGEVARFGLLPAGQDGTYFQTVVPPALGALEMRTFDSSSTISVAGTPLVPWVDYLPRDPNGTLRPLDGVQVIYGGEWDDSTTVISNADAAGKLVVITAPSTLAVTGNPPGIPSRILVSPHFSKAAAIAVVGLESFSATTRAQYHQPANAQHVPTENPAYLYVTVDAAEKLLGTTLATAKAGARGRTISGNLRYVISKPDLFTAPIRNVVAMLPGSDPTLRAEFVVLGAHNDHIGTVNLAAQLQMSDVVRPMAHDSAYVIDHLFRKGGADDPPPQLTAAEARQVNAILAHVRTLSHGTSARIDSVFNGADDDGSGSVSLLEIAQYFAAQPIKPKRSLLFVWHVGEEAGLWGSQYFTDHPTVPRDAIVAELNMDMVGRGGATDRTGNSITGAKLHGGPGYLQVVGSRRLSTELGNLVETVNRTGAHGLHFDYSMDANGHPQNIYCRSDHAEYARYGIPIAFFTTGGHADYHQLTDEPQYIDYTRMAQVDNFVADLAKHVANLGHRVVVDHEKPDPTADCKQ